MARLEALVRSLEMKEMTWVQHGWSTIDPEAGAFALQIKDVLTACGFEVTAMGGIMFREGGVAPTGTFIVVKDLNSAPREAWMIFNAFKSAALDCVFGLTENAPTNAVKIAIEAKP